ncbi:MAG: response regulator [Clostridiales bacterium]|jgi:signal transduction histidine kinase/DNA-binding response OmpR family regulator|nr:response regulator [Clostridiales bacterium]
MRNLFIIKILIVLFVILSSANMIFAWLADDADYDVLAAIDERSSFYEAWSEFYINSLTLTRLARTYIATEGDRDISIFFAELEASHFEHFYEFMNRRQSTQHEAELLQIIITSFEGLREMEYEALTAARAGDFDHAFYIIYIEDLYRAHGLAFQDNMEFLKDYVIVGLNEIVAAAQALDEFYETLAQIFVALFVVASVAGMMYLYTQVKLYIETERDAREMSERLLSSAPLVISLWDDGIPIEASEQSVNLFGLNSKEEYITRFNEITPEFQPDGAISAQKGMEFTQQALEEGSLRFEWMYQTLTGEPIPTEVHLARFKRGDKYMLIAYVTDLRQAREVMEKEQALAEMTIESQAKTRFLARMSHEIRTPLSSIMGVTEIQLQSGKLDEDMEDAFMRIHNSSDMLLTIINDILDLTKAEVGKMEIVADSYEVASMIVDTVQLNTMYIGSKGIDFDLKVDENLPTHLYGDELRIKQILNNILSNAFKYTNRGQVKFNVLLEHSDMIDEIVLVLCVTDTGVGMSDEQIEILFDEFGRAKNEQTKHVQGSGLGMNIVNHLINLMDGKAEIVSEIGKGTKVCVRLPQRIASTQVLGAETTKNLERLKDGHKAVSKNRYKIDHEPMPYGRVLVVDDVESNLYVAKGLLMPYRLQIETAGGGQEAIDKIAQGNTYDVIFMDHMMPNVDGMQATKVIQEMGYDAPIVALTANTVKGQSEIFLNNGFSAFISKPIDINILNSCLMHFVRDRHPKHIVDAARAAKAAGAESPALADDLSNELVLAFLRDAEKAIRILEYTVENNGFEGETLKSYITQVHAMKSALANVEEWGLSEISHSLERAAKDGEFDNIRERTLAFVQNLRNVVKEIRPEDIPDDYVDDEELLVEQLNIIHEACVEYDIKAANKALDVLTAVHFSKHTTAFINELSSLMLGGDFEEVAELAKQGSDNIKKGLNIWIKPFLW